MTPTEQVTGPDLTVRQATPADAGSLAALFGVARAAAFPAMPRPVHTNASVRAWFTDLLAPDGPAGRETWLAEAGGEVVGYLVLEPHWLESLYVLPGRTGEGVGTVLLDLAKALRPTGFSLWVFETNERARAFYERAGLVTVRVTDGSTNEERSPDREMAWLGADPVAALRRRVDDCDDELAELLTQRAALTGLIQRYKESPELPGRDAAREAEIVDRPDDRP